MIFSNKWLQPSFNNSDIRTITTLSNSINYSVLSILLQGHMDFAHQSTTFIFIPCMPCLHVTHASRFQASLAYLSGITLCFSSPPFAGSFGAILPSIFIFIYLPTMLKPLSLVSIHSSITNILGRPIIGALLHALLYSMELLLQIAPLSLHIGGDS